MMLVVFTPGNYQSIPLGWVARVSGNPWISKYGNILDCRSKQELASLFGGNDEDLKLKETLLQLREPLEYFQGMPVIDRIVKSLTTSQTFNSGITLPVKPGNYLGLEESVLGLPLACFPEPWLGSAMEKQGESQRLEETLRIVRDPATSKKYSLRRINKLLDFVNRKISPGSKPQGMGRYPLFFFNIGSKALIVPSEELARLEEAAYSMFQGFSQFAGEWRLSGDVEGTLARFKKKTWDKTPNLETYMLAFDFMKDREGNWTVTDVGGLGGGAIADLYFCNLVDPIYNDPANILARALSSYEARLQIVRPFLGMNLWEARMLQKKLAELGYQTEMADGQEEGVNIVTSFKPEIAKVKNSLPTACLAQLYGVPLRNYVLQSMADNLQKEFGVRVSSLVDFEQRASSLGTEFALAQVQEEFGNWMVYRGKERRTGPILIDDLRKYKPSGVVLEKMCPPWLRLTKETLNQGSLAGDYAAELRFYLAVEKR
ncbi:hypothetical protein HYT52_02725 [Candidatus Woesearchaeota archaeon]|nr:hypothetical protein [Candidatus Woesearchaeota archaeon]